jgi:ketosteroid isomerase-like protein
MSDSLDIVQALYQSFKAGDLDTSLAVIDPEVEWVEQFPYPGTYRGREALRNVFETVIREFDRYEMTFHRFVESDDIVVVLGDYRVHKKGAARDVECSFVHSFWIRDGAVVRYEQWLDTAHARDVIGLLTL